MTLLSPTVGAISVRAFCARFGIGRTTFYKEVAAGRLRLTKLGTRSLVFEADVLDWVQQTQGRDHRSGG